MRTEGWRKVFAFTLIQHIKTKSFIIGTTVVCVLVAAICVLTNVLPVLLSKDGSDPEPSGTPDGPSGSVEALGFRAVYIYDNAKILTRDDLDTLSETAEWQLYISERPYEEVAEELITAELPTAAAQITAAENGEGKVIGYNVRTCYSPTSDGGRADALNTLLGELINRRVLLNAGVAPENYADTRISLSYQRIEAGAEEWNFIQSAMNYFVPIVVSMLLFILIYSYGHIVSQSIATEKTSRVMELLLTSVRPLAVVIGKVLAMGVVSFAQFILIGSVGGISFAVSAPFGWVGKAFEIANDPEIQQSLTEVTGGFQTSEMQIAEAVNEFTSAFTPLNIIMIIVIFLLGFVFFSLIAALVGASVSRIEDLQQAMQPYAIIGVLGLYLAYFPVIFNVSSLETGEAATNPVQIFSYFFPLSSPFALPSAIMLGTLTTVQSLLGITVLAAATVLTAIAVSKVYEAIILHNGSRIKFGDIIKLAVRK